MFVRNSQIFDNVMLSAVLIAAFLFAQAPFASRCDAETARSLAAEARRDHDARRFEPAAAKFRQAFESCPERQALRLEQVNSLLMAGHLKEALEISTEVLRFDRYNANALKLKANAEFLSGNLTIAIDTFLALLDRYPGDENAAYMLGRIYYQGGKTAEAVGQFERVLRINPRSFKAWDNLGLCWQAIGNKDKAAAHFLKAIQLTENEHTDYDWAYANLADLLISMDDNEHAFAAASKAANRNPSSARNFYLGAKALEKLGKTELCINWLERASGLDPNYSEPQYLLTRVYRKLGQTEKAEQAAERFRVLKQREEHKQAKVP